MRVGFIGLGRMGTAIARCILKAGFDLTVWNRTAERMVPLMEAGANTAGTAKELAARSDILLTCLMDDRSILELMRGDEGVLAGLRQSSIHVGLTTNSPNCADELESLHREHGSQFVAGPVSGRPDAAASGTLITFLAGPAAAIEHVKPVCASYSQKVVEVKGPPRLANCVKLSINLTACSLMEVLGEAYTFAEKCGVSRKLLHDFYQMSFAHPAFKTYAQKIDDREFDESIGFPMEGGLKDVRLMLATAEQVGATVEIARLVEKKTSAAIASGMAASDWTGFTEITRREAGLSTLARQ